MRPTVHRAVAGLMIWLWISTTVILLGAEVNAEIERSDGLRFHSW